MKQMITRLREAVGALWPRFGEVTLPKRVVRSIAHNDDISEILVKVIQFAVFALWGIAYWVTPKPNPDTVSFVPAVISAYLVFTIILLFIALARRLPGWLVYFSIVVDVALLTILIWSFHIQYDQPASFSLKVVEVMNFFVLIGLRALRFQARYVVAAGAISVLCWSGVVAYVVSIDPADPMITRDYVTYITSNTILVGAEISKMISMIMFTTILAIAVRRGNHFLTTSIAEGSVASDMSRFMSSSVAKQIRGADQQIQAGQGERREVAILNVDIRGFTTMVAKMAPDEAMKLLSDYQHEIVPIVHRHNGTVDKFMGDGIMVTFDPASGSPNYCADAMRCIDDILASHPKWDGPASKLKINLAVTAGPVIFGAVGDGDRLEVTVIGACVNYSAKLEKHNKVLQTSALSGEYAFNKAVEQGYLNPVSRKLVSTIIGDDPIPQRVAVLA